MLKELIQELATQTKAAMKPEVVPVDLGPRKKGVVINGALQVLETPDPFYDYTVETQADFVTLCQRFEVELVLIGLTSIVGYVSDAKRLDKVTWNRFYTPSFDRLRDWARGVQLAQQDLIGLLRNELRTAEGASSMLASVRKLKFRKSSETASVANRGEESLSQEVLAQMTGVDQLPESLLLRTPLFKDQDPEAAKKFTLLVDPLPSVEKIKLQSLQDELDQALMGTRMDLREEMTEQLGLATIVLGQP